MDQTALLVMDVQLGIVPRFRRSARETGPSPPQRQAGSFTTTQPPRYTLRDDVVMADV
jgi:hypothetical protein